MTVEFTPWNQAKFADLAVWHNTDRVLAEHAADTAIKADADDDCHFAVAMTELFTLRGRIFGDPNILAVASASAFIEQQTRDATWIDPDRAWPADTVKAALTLWKAGRL